MTAGNAAVCRVSCTGRGSGLCFCKAKQMDFGKIQTYFLDRFVLSKYDGIRKRKKKDEWRRWRLYGICSTQ